MGAIALPLSCSDSILFISSHGYTATDGEYYIFPHDLGANSREITPDLLKSRCISGAELAEWLKWVDAGESVMVVDTAFP